MGYARGPSTSMNIHTRLESRAAILSLDGPVNTADGRISPMKSTAVTEMRMATHDGKSASRNRGSASLATELRSSRVTSS